MPSQCGTTELHIICASKINQTVPFTCFPFLLFHHVEILDELCHVLIPRDVVPRARARDRVHHRAAIPSALSAVTAEPKKSKVGG